MIKYFSVERRAIFKFATWTQIKLTYYNFVFKIIQRDTNSLSMFTLIKYTMQTLFLYNHQVKVAICCINMEKIIIFNIFNNIF